MPDPHHEVRHIVWKEVFPWLILPRVFAVAVSPAVLLLALLAVVGSAAGWRVASVFVVEERVFEEGGSVTLSLYEDIQRTTVEDVRYLGNWPGLPHYDTPPEPNLLPGMEAVHEFLELPNPVCRAAYRYGYPWFQLLSPAGDPEEGGRTWKEFAFYLSGGLWSLLVWALFAGAITRIAALRLGRGERFGIQRAITFSSLRLGQYFAAPLLPLLGVLLLAILPFIAGLLMRVSFFAAVGGLLWFLALLFGLLITLLLVGLAFGWPLMWPAISTESRTGDAFDAISRAYNYAFSRPLHYLFYVVVLGLIGVLGWFVVNLVAQGVIEMSYWAVGLGSGGGQMADIRLAAGGSELDSGMLEFGGRAVGFWVGVVHAVANAFAYAFFWCGATAIYLLLRRSVDQAEIEAVESDDDLPVSPLPPLESTRPDPRGG